MAALTGKEDKKIHINKTVYEAIINSLTESEFEEGGIIDIKNNVISHFKKDVTPLLSSEKCYIPNTEYLEDVIDDWCDCGISFAGIVHSHTKNPQPSNEDLLYAQETIEYNRLTNIILGIVTTSDSTLHLYNVTSNNFTKLEYTII